MLSHLGSPYGNCPFHHSSACGETEILYPTARPFLTLVTGVIAFRRYTIPYSACSRNTVEFLGRIRLHTAQTFSFFWFCSKEVPHYSFEFFIFVSRHNINSTGTTI